ncbi:hypothetical protein ATCC90586_003111 [Pythium insidiosum]|nr:hypothetical protein ATCC90586_003111 [Pythium insidiosum]
MRAAPLLLKLALCSILAASSCALREDLSVLVPNGAVFEVRPIGYVSSADDSPLDSFGRALVAAGRAWTLSLCKGDADGDGQTNGVELGDPCCIWTGKAPPMVTTRVSNPGDENAKLDLETTDEYLRICQAIDTFMTASVPSDSWTTMLQLHGVTWENNHVVAIDLSGNGLRGKLPRQLSHLKYLKQLKLRDNPELRGPVPSGLYEMPHLRYCYLDGTGVENVLPPSAAHSFQITKLYTSSDRAASIHFLTELGGRGATRWFADMTEAEMFHVHKMLKARHEKPHEAAPEIQRTALNATGPERVAAAIKLQRIYRARIERTKFRRFLSSLFEKHFDASTGHQYFVDKRTGEAMWERPKFVAETPRKTEASLGTQSDSNQDVWQAFDDGNGNTSTWEPPAFLSRVYQELRARYKTAASDDERFELFFRDIDKDNTGSIDRDEFARLCGELGMAMSPKEIARVFDELDTTGDGELSRDEIVAWLTRNYT